MVKVTNLRLVFVHPDLGIGGAERLVLDVAVALQNQGVQVQFLTNHFNPSHAFQELSSPNYPVAVIGDWLPRSLFGLFQAVCAYVRMLYLALVYFFFLRHFDTGADVYFVDQIPMAIPILKWTGKPIIYYCHHPDLLASSPAGFLKRLYRKPLDWLEQYGTAGANVILVNSKYTENVFRRTFPQIGNDLRILYPTIANSFLNDLSMATRKPIHQIAPEIQIEKPSDIMFLSINRYHPAKHLELAINAMSSLRSRLSPQDWNRVHLIIAGGYDPDSAVNAACFKKLIELTHKCDLVVKVVFLKSPSDKLKADLLKSCDCLLYTPTNEHFGIVPLEAMAAKKPVIACNSGGPRETIEHGVTGFLCEPSAGSLAEFMAKCIDKEENIRLGVNGYQRLNRLFSYDIFAKECMNVVTEAFTHC